VKESRDTVLEKSAEIRCDSRANMKENSKQCRKSLRDLQKGKVKLSLCLIP
jgi:hypothetical protein